VTGSVYTYSWDEVGRLSSAERTDSGAVAVLEDFAYDAAGRRVRASRHELDAAGVDLGQTHTVSVFDSLVLENAPYLGIVYQDDATTEHVYLGAGAAIAHVFEDTSGTMPTPGPNGTNGPNGNVHTFFILGDSVGSTAFVIDGATGELV
jgi:YD repeat-containing protein